MTQLLMTTSTDAVGQRDGLDAALARNSTFVAPRLGGIAPRQVEHLVGHVEAVGEPARADALRGQEDVDAAARAEVEHGLAGRSSATAVGLPQPRLASTAASGRACALGGVVQPVAERHLAGGAAAGILGAVGARTRRGRRGRTDRGPRP